MSNAAVQTQPRPGIERPAIRRFELPDLSFHGGWLLDRLLRAYPYLNQQTLAGWLRGLIYSPEAMFLYLDNAVGLAAIERSHTLSPKPLVRERFVWAREPENAAHVFDAELMYGEFARWAKHHDADTIIVGVASDVPMDKLKERFGRVFVRQEQFVKIKGAGDVAGFVSST